MGIVHLVGGEAEVEEDALNLSEAGVGGDGGDVGEIAGASGEAIAEWLESMGESGDCGGVEVEAEQPAVGTTDVKDGFGVAAGPSGCVDIPALACRPQMRHHFRRHDGKMNRAVPVHNSGGGCGVKGRLFTPHLTP